MTALAAAIFAAAIVNIAQAGAREEGRLLTATEVLEEVRAMPDVRLPDTLLQHAYGIAVIPDVTKVAFIFGGRHGNGVLSVRDKLTGPWSNPVFVSLTGGSWGFQAGAQLFRHHIGLHHQNGYRRHCRRQAHVGCRCFGCDRTCGPARLRCHRHWLQCGDLFLRAHARIYSGALPSTAASFPSTGQPMLPFIIRAASRLPRSSRDKRLHPPATAQRFLEQLAQGTGTSVRSSPVPQADVPATAGQPSSAAPTAEPARTYPLEEQKK